MDVLGAFYVPVISAIWLQNHLSFIDWKEKKIYEGKRAQQKVRSLLKFYMPPRFLQAVLWQDAKAFSRWTCQKKDQFLESCRKGALEVVWSYRRRHLKEISILSHKSSHKLEITVESVKTKVLKKRFQKPSDFQKIL